MPAAAADQPRRMNAKRSRRSNTVPVHSLYGEPTLQAVDFLHIERIRARSEQYDWSIDVHRHPGLVQVVLIFGGAARARLDDAWLDLAAPAAITVPPGTIHSFAFEPETRGFVVTLADGQLDAMALGSWIRDRLFHRGVTLPLDEDEAIMDRLQMLCTELLREHETVDIGRVPILEAVLGVILLTLARRVDASPGSVARPQPHEQFREFRTAVEEHYADHWPLPRYAELLHMSESSLDRICRAVAGTSAFAIVQGRLELEARRRLIYTTVPVQRLAADLGFLDPSYFARFFKRRTGVAPSEFRRNNQPS
jgi:AraC family transcriptional activator of pobA